jgi:acetyl esterase
MFEYDIEDVEFLRHGDTALLARLYRPQGQGPFPMVAELHGGVWSGSRRRLSFVRGRCPLWDQMGQG